LFINQAGFKVEGGAFFDTFTVDLSSKGHSAKSVAAAAAAAGCNVRIISESSVGLSFGESHTRGDVEALLSAFGVSKSELDSAAASVDTAVASQFARKTEFMTHPVFNTHHSETQVHFIGYFVNFTLVLRLP
jgi:glycine dehydrogenase